MAAILGKFDAGRFDGIKFGTEELVGTSLARINSAPKKMAGINLLA